MALASASRDADLVVVGAGAAGLAATALLRDAGLHVVLLEAGHRIGGRAWTDHPAVLGGTQFDHGALWLHAAHRNPFVALAREKGMAVHPDTPWEKRLTVFDAPGQRADMAAYEAAEARWHAAVKVRLDGPDTDLEGAARDVAGDRWTPTIEAWEGAIIAAGDARDLSLQDWHRNALDGENFIAPAGFGALVCTCLSPGEHGVRLGAAVTRITAAGGGVRVSSAAGDVRASAVIVTVSTGVLRAETIAFEPALPQAMLAALDGLPMGLLSKIALRAATVERLGLGAGANVFRRLPARGGAFLSTMFWSGGQDLAIGYVGGRHAWALEGRATDAEAFMRAELDAAFGSPVSQIFGRAMLQTDWGQNPLFRGAYAYARPGCAGARDTLGTPQWDGRLLFAGEACATDGRAGTVAGAYEAGRRAARSARALVR